MQVVICDVGLGNVRSVERALRAAAREAGVDVDVTLTGDPDAVRTADKVVMPGQSAFRDYAGALGHGLGAAVLERVRAGAPYLGICMGLQVLFETSEEAPGVAGLGLFPGAVQRLPPGTEASTGAPLKIPHVGWNTAEPTAARGLLPAQPEHYYFVHSYVVVPADPAIVAATTSYGAPFVSAVAHGNVFACQFHPEKSQREGIALLGRFLLV